MSGIANVSKDLVKTLGGGYHLCVITHKSKINGKHKRPQLAAVKHVDSQMLNIKYDVDEICMLGDVTKEVAEMLKMCYNITIPDIPLQEIPVLKVTEFDNMHVLLIIGSSYSPQFTWV